MAISLIKEPGEFNENDIIQNQKRTTRETHLAFPFIPVAHDAQTKHDVNNINDVDIAPFTVLLGRLEQLEKVNGIEREAERVDENHDTLPECLEQ